MQIYVLFAISAYFLFALTGIIDKILMASEISSPRIYAGAVGVLSIFALILVPFGVTLPESTRHLLLAILSGITSIIGLWFLYSSIKRYSATKSITLQGAFTPVFTAIFSIIIFDERLLPLEILGIALLIVGGLLIYLTEEEGNIWNSMLLKLTALASLFMAISAASLKAFFLRESFVNGLFWPRVGSILTGMVLLFPVIRDLQLIDRGILKKSTSISLMFILNQILGVGGLLMQSYAISKGSATIVNAMQPTQYIWLFGLNWFLAKHFKVLKDEPTEKEKLLVLIATLSIVLGLILVSGLL